MAKNLRNARVALFATCLCVAGCAPSLEQLKMREADTNTPANYGAIQPTPAPDAKPLELPSWRDFFEDEGLKAFIDSALQKNQELAIFEQEVNVSQNEIMSREGEYLPKVGVKGGAGLDKVGKSTSQGVSDDAHGLKQDLPNFSLGFAATWELDIWKKLRNATKAALFNYQATVEGRNFMVTRLVAEIAQSYYELLALQKMVVILEQNIAIQQRALDIIRLEKKAARVTELAVKRFEAEVLKNQSRRYTLQQSIVEKQNQLNFLAGRYPQPIDTQKAADFLTLVPAAVQAGLPAKLLDNRPDVRQAELQLKAAKLNVDVARARFYPSLSIDAGIGFQAFNTKHLFVTPDSLVYNVAANLTAPLLNRKAIAADYLSAGSKQVQAVYNFEKTLLHAYTEVVNQLNKVENLKSTFMLKAQQVDALTNAVEISNTLFAAARCDYMEVLLTRRDALEAQMDLVEVKEQQLAAVVALYQSLGGGWKAPAATAAVDPAVIRAASPPAAAAVPAATTAEVTPATVVAEPKRETATP